LLFLILCKAFIRFLIDIHFMWFIFSIFWSFTFGFELARKYAKVKIQNLIPFIYLNLILFPHHLLYKKIITRILSSLDQHSETDIKMPDKSQHI